MHSRIAGLFTGRVTKWIVVAFWVGMVVAIGPLSGKLNDVVNNDAASWLPHSAESTKALDQLADVQDPDDIPTTIVYHREGGLTRADLKTIKSQIPAISKVPGIATKAPAKGKPAVPQVSFPTKKKTGQQAGLVSPDAEVATVQLMLNFHGEPGTRLLDARDYLIDKTKSTDTGLDVYVSGTGGDAADQSEAFSGIDGTLLYAAAGVVIVILLITYRSPVLWALPLISVVISLVVSMGVVYLLAKHAGLTLNGQSKAILDVLVFGAGTDYALLLIARYREELRNHPDRHRAMAVALHRAAPAIIASGATVALGMLCLLAAEMGSTKGLGPVCAVGVGVCLVVMLTLLPALLVVTGRWVFWPARPRFRSREPSAAGVWARLGRRIARAPRLVWFGTGLVLLACCGGLLTLNIHTLSGSDQYTKTFDSTIGDQLMQDHDLVDLSTPIRVVSDKGTEQQVVTALKKAGYDNAEAVTTPGSPIAVTAVPLVADPLSPKAFDTVRSVRTVIHGIDGAHARATGTSAVQLDTGEATTRDAEVIIPLILCVVLVILMLLLRAMLAPLLLMGTVVLSFGAALGLSSLLFRHLGFAGEGFEFPLYVFVFLVALGIDYNIFLMHRVREETAEFGDTRRASVVALSATGGVITSAGIVLAATFAVLATLPFVAFVEIGAAVALGVLLDTLVVRSVLVTALNLDLGNAIWWPSRLSRRRRVVRRPYGAPPPGYPWHPGMGGPPPPPYGRPAPYRQPPPERFAPWPPPQPHPQQRPYREQRPRPPRPPYPEQRPRPQQRPYPQQPPYPDQRPYPDEPWQ